MNCVKFQCETIFLPRSSWKAPLGHSNLKMFLIWVEEELSEATKEPIHYSNLSKEEW